MRNEESLYCDYCGKMVLARKRKTTNHLLHIIIGVLTSGLWFIIYGFILVATPKEWMCSFCGKLLNNVTKKKQSEEERRARLESTSFIEKIDNIDK